MLITKLNCLPRYLTDGSITMDVQIKKMSWLLWILYQKHEERGSLNGETDMKIDVFEVSWLKGTF